SDKVWKKTHKIGGKLFKLFGVAMLIGLLFNNMMFWIVLIGAVGLSLFLFVYSYVIWKNEK
ncbi:MAG: SdpI family protein, partial [Nanoarchaeota archaeon]